MVKTKILALGIGCMFIAACGPVYTSSQGGGIPPAVRGINWINSPPATQQCAMGIMADGTVAVASAFNFPAGLAADWFAWKMDITTGPTGHSLVDCWNTAQWNWPNAFALYTQCYGQPVVRSTWNDFGAASAWVQIPFCQCNLSCQWNMGMVQGFWREPMNSCFSTWSWDWMCFWAKPQSIIVDWPPGGLATTDTETVPPPPGDPPPTYTDGQSLPTDAVAPSWDVNTPPPVSLPIRPINQ